MSPPATFPIDRVLWETTEFCRNQCSFCYGDYNPDGRHMVPQDFARYLSNLLAAHLLDPDCWLVLFGGEILEHPQAMEICRQAWALKQETMNLVVITSGKYEPLFAPQVGQLIQDPSRFHHWEVSVKDHHSLEFGLELFRRGHQTLLRHDFLGRTELKRSIGLFLTQARGRVKDFSRLNQGLEKTLRQALKNYDPLQQEPIIEEFFLADGQGQVRGAGLTFSPLDRGVMRRAATPTPAHCSLLRPPYDSAIHLARDGWIYPCHLPRYKKRCQPLGHAGDMAFLRRYHEHLAQFKRDLLAWQEQLPTPAGVCLEGCRGCLPGFAGEQ